MFVGKPRILKENKGQRIVIECDCDSKQTPNIIWLKNNEPVKNEGRYLIDIDTNQAPHLVIILEIDNVRPEDNGTYKCTAKNNKGETSINIEVKLDGMFPFKQSVFTFNLEIYTFLLRHQAREQAR